MAKRMFERSTHPEHVPSAPAPSAASAVDGMESTRALARCYLPDAVRLLAGIAFASDSEAALHTKMLCAKEIVAIAGVIPQVAPAPPQPHDEHNDGGEVS